MAVNFESVSLDENRWAEKMTTFEWPIRYAALAAETSRANLPGAAPKSAEVETREMLVQSLRGLNHRVESAWTGHVPFLFSLLAFVRPKRFVELGTHHGLSFFAACQLVSELHLETTCVAVDHWLGDTQAGIYSEEVFAGFEKHLIENYSGFAEYVRDDFLAASQVFEANSIDLLHIDGFHTYEAVKNDFEAWLPSTGIILFHDVNEYGRDFGVWRFWQEIVENYPYQTFSFGHSHGLGVLSLGSVDNFRMKQLFDYWSKPSNSTFVRQFYEQVANLSDFDPARFLYEKLRLDETVRELRAHVDSLSVEISRLRLGNEELVNEAAFYRQEAQDVRSDFENSKSWKITRILRRS
jgi:predicted O-methyltransferase YrrM